jgi:hypothetical protein
MGSRPKEVGGQRWFHLYPKDNVKGRRLAALDELQPELELHLRGVSLHRSEKNFDPASSAYKTTWAEINVTCEACHGPGSNHIAWAHKEGDWQKFDSDKGLAVAFNERKDISWDAGGRNRQCAPQRAAAEHARNRHVRALPRAR